MASERELRCRADLHEKETRNGKNVNACAREAGLMARPRATEIIVFDPFVLTVVAHSTLARHIDVAQLNEFIRSM